MQVGALVLCLSARAGAEPQRSAPSPNSEDVRYVDAHCDHVLVASTGETHPAGTFYITDYEVFVPHVGYALTDRFEVMMTWIPGEWLDVTAKVNVLRWNLLRSALIFSYDKPTSLYDPETGYPPRQILRLGAAQELCFSNLCWSSVTINAFANYDVRPGGYPRPSPSTILLIGGTFALGRNIKLLFEPQFTWHWHYPVGTSNDIGGPTSLGVGIRATGPNVAFDIGLVPLDSGETGGPLPWIALTYRTSGRRSDE